MGEIGTSEDCISVIKKDFQEIAISRIGEIRSPWLDEFSSAAIAIMDDRVFFLKVREIKVLRVLGIQRDIVKLLKRFRDLKIG